jgi:hypothetical protein
MTNQNVGTERREYTVHIPSLLEIFWGTLANTRRRVSEWRRNGFLRKDKMRQPRRRFTGLETLEPRLLLSADVTYASPSDVALDGTLTVEDVAGVPILRLLDNQSDVILAEAVLDQDLNVFIAGSDSNDTLAIDFDLAGSFYAINISYDAKGGTDVLQGPHQANTWHLTASATGRLNNVVFTGVEGLAGGADQDAFIIFDAAASIALNGAGGSDTVMAADTANAWFIDGPNTGTLNGTTFSGIENLRGGSGRDTVKFTVGGFAVSSVDGGGDEDFLQAADFANIWNLTSTNAGTLNGQAFAAFENTSGGDGDDIFRFLGGGISGAVLGEFGHDILDYSAYQSDVVVDHHGHQATETGSFDDIDDVIPGQGANTIVLDGSHIGWSAANVLTNYQPSIYAFDLVAWTGAEGFLEFGVGPSINDDGRVAFVATRSHDGVISERIYVSDVLAGLVENATGGNAATGEAIVIRSPHHGLTSNMHVRISGVTGKTGANSVDPGDFFIVNVIDEKLIYIHNTPENPDFKKQWAGSYNVKHHR